MANRKRHRRRECSPEQASGAKAYRGCRAVQGSPKDEPGPRRFPLLSGPFPRQLFRRSGLLVCHPACPKQRHNGRIAGLGLCILGIIAKQIGLCRRYDFGPDKRTPMYQLLIALAIALVAVAPVWNYNNWSFGPFIAVLFLLGVNLVNFLAGSLDLKRHGKAVALICPGRVSRCASYGDVEVHRTRSRFSRLRDFLIGTLRAARRFAKLSVARKRRRSSDERSPACRRYRFACPVRKSLAQRLLAPAPFRPAWAIRRADGEAAALHQPHHALREAIAIRRERSA